MYVCANEQVFMVCVSVLHRGHYGEECVFASTLCKYDMRKGYLFILSWARIDESVWQVFLLRCL